MKESTQQIIRTFQQERQVEIETLSLAQLRSADEDLGPRDIQAGFRIALRNRIRDLEEADRRLHERSVGLRSAIIGRLVGSIVGALVGAVVAFYLAK